MRGDDQAIDLVIGIVGKCEDRPINVALTRTNFDAAHDAVSARRGRNLNAISIAALTFQHAGQVNRGHVSANADRVNRVRLRNDSLHDQQDCKRR